jgi:replicative DNA helicase
MPEPAPTYEANGEAPQHTAYDVERQLLGAAMIEKDACATVVDLCEPAFFAERSNGHAEIFEAIQRLFDRDAEAPLPAVTQEVDSAEPTYLTDLTTSVGTAAGVEHGCRVLQEKWMAREGKDVLRGAAGHLDNGGDVFETLGGVVRRLTKISMTDSDETHISRGAQAALQDSKAWREGETPGLIPTGLPSLDDVCDGFPVGELTTFAAQTGAGKTSFIVQVIATLARAWAGKDKSLLLFSAEMDVKQLAQKAASQIARVDLRALRRGTAEQEAYDRFEEALSTVANLSIHVDDNGSPTMQHIRARCQRIDVQHDLGFVAVDYDEKVRGEGDSQEQRVASIAEGSKTMAKRIGVPWVNLSQYSRSASGEMGTPQDGWLRYSGKKEQESALILHWHWPGYWVENKGKDPMQVDGYDEAEPGKGWMYVTKNRITGGTGAAKLYFRQEHTRFEDPKDPEYDENDRAPF